MRYTRLYVQFNNLVFDGVDMIRDFDASVSFKGSSQAYSYGHGAYRPFKTNYGYAEAQTASMTINLNMKRLPCEHRPYFGRFVKTELSKPGKLWAIEGNELLWTNAVVTNISHDLSARENELEFDVDFELFDGVWRKADKQKTFLVPYDICALFDCKGYKTVNPCAYDDCCTSCLDKELEKRLDNSCECCCVDELDKSMALCYHTDELQDYYSCSAPYQIVYDCTKGEEFFGDEFLGAKLCERDSCSGIIAGRFYSETDIPTTEVGLIIKGHMLNPIIEINGNRNVIKGEYDGTLTIKASGDVYYAGERDCCDTLLDPSVWSIPSNNTYGFTVNPQWNSVIINTNDCCGMTCAYIQHNALTY